MLTKITLSLALAALATTGIAMAQTPPVNPDTSVSSNEGESGVSGYEGGNEGTGNPTMTNPNPGEPPMDFPTLKPVVVGKGCMLLGCQEDTCAEAGTPQPQRFCPEMFWMSCYRTTGARCEKQANGRCGWTPSPALTACFEKEKAGR